jgi:mannose-1-phosphate guanylyltransferase
MRAVLMAGGSGTRLRPLTCRSSQTDGSDSQPSDRRTYYQFTTKA